MASVSKAAKLQMKHLHWMNKRLGPYCSERRLLNTCNKILMNYLYKHQCLLDEFWSNRGCSLDLSFPIPLNSTVEDFVVGLQFRFDHQELMNPAHWEHREHREH
jgi:hypothetical protein